MLPLQIFEGITLGSVPVLMSVELARCCAFVPFLEQIGFRSIETASEGAHRIFRRGLRCSSATRLHRN